jgi:hypothetical protein
MGMYDEIQVKHKLPIPKELEHLSINWKNYKFQTKDLDNCLSEYIIKNNSLYEKIIERTYIHFTEEEMKQRKKQKQFLPLWKDVIEKSSSLVKNKNFHGCITFYTYDELNEQESFWVEFKAYFCYGKLDKIEFAEFKKDKSNKDSCKKLLEEHEKRKKHPWYIFKKYASYVGWSFVWRYIAKMLYSFSNLCQEARMFIIKNLL